MLEQAESFRRHDLRFRNRRHDRRDELSQDGNDVQFRRDSGVTGGTLTLHDASLTANILMIGDYSKSSFTLAPDSGTGTLVKFVRAGGRGVVPCWHGAAIRVRKRRS
jgi:hypothetical protein